MLRGTDSRQSINSVVLRPEKISQLADSVKCNCQEIQLRGFSLLFKMLLDNCFHLLLGIHIESRRERCVNAFYRFNPHWLRNSSLSAAGGRTAAGQTAFTRLTDWFTGPGGTLTQCGLIHGLKWKRICSKWQMSKMLLQTCKSNSVDWLLLFNWQFSCFHLLHWKLTWFLSCTLNESSAAFSDYTSTDFKCLQHFHFNWNVSSLQWLTLT